MSILSPHLPVIFLMGPTASGKTALAIELFKAQKFEIISVDSAMVYQQLNIGSAKPSLQELISAPHHLIDFVDPKNAYSASQFVDDAKQLINEIHRRKKVPLLVGGTMLYFKALRDGLADLPTADLQVRASLKRRLDESSIEVLYDELAAVDEQTAQRLHRTDRQRILRALEVYQVTRKPLSAWHAEQSLEVLPNPLLSIVLAPADRSILHQRIEKRFKQMMAQGFLAEVKSLYARGDLSLDCPSIKSVGYRQLWQYLRGELALDKAEERAIIATRQLAKRQLTWLRQWQEAKWYDPLDSFQLNQAKERILDFIREF